MREQHRLRIGCNTRFPFDRRVEQSGVEPQEHEVCPAGVKPIGGQVYLLRSRKMDKTHLSQRVGAVRSGSLGRIPLGGTAQMNQ